MSKTAGRPKGANNKVLMAFRFPRGLANSIKKIAARHRLTQARVLELLVIRHGKELSRVKPRFPVGTARCAVTARKPGGIRQSGRKQRPTTLNAQLRAERLASGALSTIASDVFSEGGSFRAKVDATAFPNCCAPNPESFRGGAEQNPQVPLASEDAFAQVPGNAETAVGFNFSPTPRRTPAKPGPRFADKQTLTIAVVPTAPMPTAAVPTDPTRKLT